MKTTRQIKQEAKRMVRFCLVNGLLDGDRTRQVVQRVIDAKRRGGLALLSHFQRLVKLDSARRRAQVESATPLSEDLRANVEAGLVRTYGPGISASFLHNPGLIGGIRIKVGSDVYDGSVRARLAELEKTFSN
jgi:F-type H+-transporting ATPase subunit delta